MDNPLIVSKTYELLNYLTKNLLRTMPKDQKFILGDRIQNAVADNLESYITAYYSNSQEKRPILKQANIKLEILRHYIRLCHDLEFINIRKYEFISQKINEIGKMNGDWLKSTY